MAGLFGWQGILLEHPEDWAPVVLAGDRRSGYARLASPRALSLQLRWAPRGSESLERALARYLDRLSRDARRKRTAFAREVRSEGDAVLYRYRGELDGEGRLFPTGDGRVAFIEAVGETTTARTRLVDRVCGSFSTKGERWSVFGLDVTLPGLLKVENKEFLAGRTVLALGGRGVRVAAERWGLAESLLARLSLDGWARGRLGGGWEFAQRDDGLRARRTSFGLRKFDEALVRHQPDRNGITLLRVQTRDEAWRPQWDWLN